MAEVYYRVRSDDVLPLFVVGTYSNAKIDYLALMVRLILQKLVCVKILLSMHMLQGVGVRRLRCCWWPEGVIADHIAPMRWCSRPTALARWPFIGRIWRLTSRIFQ